MRTYLVWRCVCVAALVSVSCLVLWFYPIRLGLDLRGGVHLVLRVDTEEGIRREATAATDRGEPFSREPAALAALRRELIAEARQVVERRVNELGVSEPTIAIQGPDRDQLLVELAGVYDVDRAKAVIRTTGLLELSLIETGPAVRDEHAPSPPDEGLRVLPAHDDETASYVVRSVPVVYGPDIRTARPSLDDFNQPAVSFVLSPDAATRFAAFTDQHIGRRLAIILDGVVHQAPVIEGRISAEGSIQGGFTPQDAQELAVVLRSGSLRAPLEYLEQSTIGPTLGADAIRSGALACGLAAMLTGGFMVVYYRGWGVNAVVSMLINLTILLAVMAYLGVVLTLPGIAGLVLTIGIGVDSSILIFERIKEAIADGETIRAAVRSGFDRVFLTLLDTHIAALIGAAFLFQFGTSAVQGFAVTLSLGLAANMVTSIFVSRTLFQLRLGRSTAGLST